MPDIAFCFTCHKITYTTEAVCFYCDGPAQQVDVDNVADLLRELRARRVFREPRDRFVRCTSCGGLPRLSRSQRFRTSGAVRGAGAGRLAGQPGNVSSRTTIQVAPCRCMDDHERREVS